MSWREIQSEVAAAVEHLKAGVRSGKYPSDWARTDDILTEPFAVLLPSLRGPDSFRVDRRCADLVEALLADSAALWDSLARAAPDFTIEAALRLRGDLATSATPCGWPAAEPGIVAYALGALPKSVVRRLPASLDRDDRARDVVNDALETQVRLGRTGRYPDQPFDRQKGRDLPAATPPFHDWWTKVFRCSALRSALRDEVYRKPIEMLDRAGALMDEDGMPTVNLIADVVGLELSDIPVSWTIVELAGVAGDDVQRAQCVRLLAVLDKLVSDRPRPLKGHRVIGERIRRPLRDDHDLAQQFGCTAGTIKSDVSTSRDDVRDYVAATAPDVLGLYDALLPTGIRRDELLADLLEALSHILPPTEHLP